MAVVAGAERMGLLDLVHDEGKEAMRGPDRLAWLEAAPERDVSLHLSAPGSQAQIERIRHAAGRLAELAEQATTIVAREDEDTIMGAFDREDD